MLQNIEYIKQNANIVEVIQSFIPLRKNGGNYISKCPFHDEDTPSFTVNLRKNIFHCFGCNEGGNAVDFVMKYERIDFVQAIKKVANICNIDIQEHKTYTKKALDYIEITERYQELYNESLKALLQHDKLCQYLEKRGIKKEFFSVYKIGLCLDKQTIIKIMGYKLSLELGLIIGKSDYNFFQNRLLFFISDAKSNIVGISGRIHDYNNFSKSPKYINSKESTIYKKSEILYNLHFALQIMKEHKKNEIYIVEGYVDALTCNLLHIPAIALCGTGFNKNHLTLLNKYIDEKTKIYLALDSDIAGNNATIRAYKILLQYGFIEAKVAILKGYKDLNEFYILSQDKTNIPFMIYEALFFCLETEIANAITIAQKRSKLAFYVNFYKNSNDYFTKQYMSVYIKKYIDIQNQKPEQNTHYNIKDEHLLLAILANDRKKRFIAEPILQSSFFSDSVAFLDIMANKQTKNMRKYMLMPYAEISDEVFYKIIIRYKIIFLKQSLQAISDVKQKLLIKKQIQDLKKRLN